MPKPAVETASEEEVTSVNLQEQETKPLTVTGDNMTPMALLSLGVKSGATIDTLRELMSLEREWRADQAEIAFNQAFACFSAAVPVIEKTRLVVYTNKDNSLTQYKHASLADIARGVNSILAESGFSYSWEIEQESGLIKVTCILIHRDGHARKCSLMSTPDSSGGKNPVQAVASTVSYLKRYTLEAVTGLSTDEFDDDGQAAGNLVTGEPDSSVETVTAEEAASIREMIAATAYGEDGILQAINERSVESIPRDRIKRVYSYLQSLQQGLQTTPDEVVL